VSIALAVWFSNLMIRLMANGGAPLAIEVRPDLRVIGFTAAIGMVTCLFFGLAPALQATQINLNPGLKETAARGRRGLSNGLVVAQIAFALMLTAAAGLFVRTLINFYTLDAGFKANGVLLFGLNAAKAGYKDERFRALEAQILDRLNSLPGVRSASVSLLPPVSGGGWSVGIEVEGYTHRLDEDNVQHFNEIGPKFFQTTGTAVVMGREFNERDVPGAPGVAVVNETFARYYFAGRSPIGKQIKNKLWENRRVEIVGVVKDMKYISLRQEFPRTVYLPALQNTNPPGWGTYLVRTVGAPVGFTHSVEQAIREINPALRVSDVVTLAEHVDRSIFKERIMAALASIFGLLAIAVACLGVYGTMAFQVVRRTNEIGIRIALGAQQGDLIWMILREITILLAFGIMGGLLGALATTRLAEAMLFQVKPADPSTFVLAAAICSVVVLAAGYLPARRASLVDPIEALRCE
jgi:predicted permease